MHKEVIDEINSVVEVEVGQGVFLLDVTCYFPFSNDIEIGIDLFDKETKHSLMKDLYERFKQAGIRLGGTEIDIPNYRKCKPFANQNIYRLCAKKGKRRCKVGIPLVDSFEHLNNIFLIRVFYKIDDTSFCVDLPVRININEEQEFIYLNVRVNLKLDDDKIELIVNDNNLDLEAIIGERIDPYKLYVYTKNEIELNSTNDFSKYHIHCA